MHHRHVGRCQKTSTKGVVDRHRRQVGATSSRTGRYGSLAILLRAGVHAIGRTTLACCDNLYHRVPRVTSTRDGRERFQLVDAVGAAGAAARAVQPRPGIWATRTAATTMMPAAIASSASTVRATARSLAALGVQPATSRVTRRRLRWARTRTGASSEVLRRRLFP